MSPEPRQPVDPDEVLRIAVARFKRVRAYFSKVEAPALGERRRTAKIGFTRDPKKLADLLDDFGTVNGFADQLSVTGLAFNWVEIVGPELAEHLVIGDFDEASGRLRVQASSTAWATQVRMLVPVILARIAEEIGEGVVQDLVIDGPSAPSWKHGKRSVPGRGPRDTYG